MKILLISLTCMFCAAMEVHLVLGYDFPMTFPYTLQATPIAFTEEPESASVLKGTTISLSCNTTILQNSNYRLPELIWRYNGQLLNGSHPPHFRISTLPNNSRSELEIMDVSQRDSGYYECVVFDGYHLLESGKAAYTNILASQRAQLKVIDVNVSVSEQVEAVSVAVGQYLLLPCETGAMYSPGQPTWRKDGAEVTGTGNEVVLGNGTLLILGATEETEGSYQCTGHYNYEALNSTTYNVSLTEGGSGTGLHSPVVIIDGPAGVIEDGQRLNLTCYTLNSEGLQLQWLKDGKILPESEKLLSIVQDSGSYTCQIVSSSAVLATNDFIVTIANKPVVELGGCTRNHPEQLCGDDTTRAIYYERTVDLTCNTSDPLATIYWYKNGQNVTSGNTLSYRGDLLGVYQCFAMTPAGIGYDTVRVIRQGFTNPPGKFACQAVDQRMDITRPSVILSWERPTLQTFPVGSDGVVNPPKRDSYVIVYEAYNVTTYNVTVDAEITTTQVDLPKDAQYTFSVYYVHADESFQTTAIAQCENSTFIRRTAVPRRLIVSCPETIPTGDLNNTNITIPVEWISPVKKPDVKRIHLASFRSVCLQSNTTKEDTLLQVHRSNEFLTQDDQLFNFEVGPLLPGTVCLFGGYYILRTIDFRSHFRSVPNESCGVPVPQSTAKVQLKLTCSNSVAAVEVNTPNGDTTLRSTDVRGKCISADWSDTSNPLTEHYLEPGNTSISDLPNNTICSFYGSYQLQTSEVVDFEPVQCIMNRPSPPVIPLPPTTTEDTTTTATKEEITATDTPETTKAAAGSGFTISPAAITWVAVDLSLAVLVIVTLVVACFAWKSYSRRLIKERKKQLHIWDDFITQQEGEDNLDQDPHVLPQFPYASHAPDSLSITTEVDYLYKEEGRAVLSQSSLSSLMKSMQNDEKAIETPKLIMDRFLNGCHQRVWESSHESLSNIPPSSTQEQGNSRLIEHCAENTATYDSANPVPSDSHLAADSGNLMAQHYTIPLQTDFPNRLTMDSYIPSGGSSGYGTCSDHYFESGSSAYTSATNDYFKSRLADVAECTSLSTCGEEEGQQTNVVDIMKRSRDSCHHPLLACSEAAPCSGTDTDKDCLNRPNRSDCVLLPIKSTGKHRFGTITTQCAGHMNRGITCTNSDLINRHGDFTPSSVPPDHYFTDDEGYLRFSKETAV